MRALAADYGTDFLSLYSANVGVRRPGRLSAGNVLNVGANYAIQVGDANAGLAALAARFFVTPAALLAANPDTAYYWGAGGDAAALRTGDTVCVVLSVCSVRCGLGSECALDAAPLDGIAMG